MTSNADTLEIDFGLVGPRFLKQAFCIRLLSTQIEELIEHAAQAHRVYELFSIRRPGDVWEYVTVEIVSASQRLLDLVLAAQAPQDRDHATATDQAKDRLTFGSFNRLFEWCWDDTEPEDECWLNHRDGAEMYGYADRLLVRINAAKAALNYDDPLIRHETDSIERATHPYDYLTSNEWRIACVKHPPRKPRFSAEFYIRLRKLLNEPLLASVAYAGHGDYMVLRECCAEQVQRVPAAGLAIYTIDNGPVNNTPWGAHVQYFSEGLGEGQLTVEDGYWRDALFVDLLTTDSRRQSPNVLTTKDRGEIQGYSRTTGDGWVLYSATNPIQRQFWLDWLRMREGSAT